jgi:hypothetical protein
MLTAKVTSLEVDVARLSRDLSEEQEKRLEYEDEAAHLRHILEARDAGINIPVNGSKDLSFQVECLTEQNQFLNQELMTMRGIHRSKDTQIQELRAEVEQGKSTLMLLLQVVAEEQAIEALRRKATQIVEGAFAGDLNAKAIPRAASAGGAMTTTEDGVTRRPSSTGSSSFSRQDSRRRSTMIRRYDKWGFAVSNDLSATYHALRQHNEAAEKRTHRKWEAFLQAHVVRLALCDGHKRVALPEERFAASIACGSALLAPAPACACAC